MRIALLIAASLLAAACSGREAEAQRADTGTDTGTDIAQPDAGGAFAAKPPSAQDFAQAVAMSDMYELGAANIAAKKVKTGPVREFANMMIADHSKSSKALKDAIAASGQSLAMPAKLGGEHQSLINALGRLDGEDFEREYMAQQMTAHRKALDLLKSYAGGGDMAELRQFAQATIPAVQKHQDWLNANGSATSPSQKTAEATGGNPGATMAATLAP